MVDLPLNLYSTGSFASALNCLLLALLAGFSPGSGVGEGRTFSSCLRKGFLMIAMAVGDAPVSLLVYNMVARRSGTVEMGGGIGGGQRVVE